MILKDIFTKEEETKKLNITSLRRNLTTVYKTDVINIYMKEVMFKYQSTNQVLTKTGCLRHKN